MEVSIYCPHCHQRTALSMARAEYEGSYGTTYHTPAARKKAYREVWWIGICNGCKLPCLVLNEGEMIYSFPSPHPTDKNIPPVPARDLDEAKVRFSVACYRACAVMARRCIQVACKQKGAASGDLVDQISELSKKGVITKDIEEWATVVRWAGNDAAHANKDDVTKEDAEDCLKLAEQFMHVIFVTPAVAKARRAARGK
jgi:HEPN domain-containing protein